MHEAIFSSKMPFDEFDGTFDAAFDGLFDGKHMSFD